MGSPRSVADGAIDADRLELLDLAFAAASSMPPDPHVKNRGRAQDEVVLACFELGLPERALHYADQILDWRRGAAYAEYAARCARHGMGAEAEEYLKRAGAIAVETGKDPNQQEWRSDRVRAAIARARYLLGQSEAAARLEVGLEPAERASIEATKAGLTDPSRFDAQMEAADAVFAQGDFDQSCAALRACAALFDRFYDDHERRAKAESRLRSGFPRLPLQLRIEQLLAAGDIALAHDDSAKALDLGESARTLLDGGSWAPEDRIPMMARATTLKAHAGDKAHATAEIDAALALYDRERARIVDIRRAAAIRPVAEACLALGDRERAGVVYSMVLDAGAVNPNSRPRADDLVATCCSMAIHGFRPDPALRSRISGIREKLGDPW